MASWDLHATATPGDYLEVETLRGVVPESVLVTARKGTFGHGMSAGGGWELTAQYLGYERGRLFPTPLQRTELNGEIAKVHSRFVFDQRDAGTLGRGGQALDGHRRYQRLRDLAPLALRRSATAGTSPPRPSPGPRRPLDRSP